MLSLGPIGRRLPSQSCQRPVLELVRNVWRGARSPCSSLQSGRGSFRAWSTSRGLILRAKFEQPSRTLCSLVDSPQGRTRMAANDAPHHVSEQPEKTFYFGKFKIDPTEDGAQAGQTVPHVHVHILPRKSGDFENNDEVYDAIDQKERQLSGKLDLDKERKDRTFDEMAAESAELRALF